MFLKLRPNCLLTRYPLVLVTLNEGLRGFFRPARWYATVLQAHGYQVVQLRVDSASDQKICQYLQQVQNQGRRVHLLCQADIRNQIDFQTLPVEPLVSLTTLHFAPFGLQNLLLSLRPRQKLKWREQILNLAISLAENDLKCSH